MKWRLIGPFRGGRSIAVAGIAGNPEVYYFGGASGGVWKTTDGGVNWQPMFDKEPVSSIGAIAVAPSDPNVIYVGTGEACIRGDISHGDGVYKSVDGGQTWKNVGLKDTQTIG
ncbi:MAG TPA: glycosyl hydrolase, partial [Terriglobia bacterium]|nr:glycosyl hydrolase [Terriglobia bacterium]HUY15054.1 glycosyl hydrolase [Terriglobia bacterium]